MECLARLACVLFVVLLPSRLLVLLLVWGCKKSTAQAFHDAMMLFLVALAQAFHDAMMLFQVALTQAFHDAMWRALIVIIIAVARQRCWLDANR